MSIRSIVRSIAEGKRKGIHCQKWLHIIQNRVNQFLMNAGFRADALPGKSRSILPFLALANIFARKLHRSSPRDWAGAKSNSEVLKQILSSDFPDLDDFLEMTRCEVYVVVDALIAEIDFVLGHNWRDEGIDVTQNQVSHYFISPSEKSSLYILKRLNPLSFSPPSSLLDP